jgi:chromosome segregation ATPase
MTRIALLAAAALALPAAAAAQETQPAAPQPQAPAAAAPQDEITQIQQRLAALQQQAMQDSAVKAAEATFGAELMAAMERLDPTAKEKAARGEALNQEVEAARAASDNAKLNALATEAQGLQAFFTALRTRALALPEIQEKRQAYLAVVFARMNQIDPQAQALVTRLNELRAAAQPQG